MSNNDQPDWKTADFKVKQEAVYKFCELLDKNANGERESCKGSTRIARDKLRDAGNFKNMPEDVPIYVCEDNAEDRSKVLAIILPTKGKMPDRQHFDIKEACPCTWTPYPKILSESLQPGDKIVLEVRRS